MPTSSWRGAERLGSLRESLGAAKGTPVAFARTAVAADALAPSLPEDLREIFQAKPDSANALPA